MNAKNDMPLALPTEPEPEQMPATTSTFVMNTAIMSHVMQFAEVMAKSVVTVPKHLRNKVGDCAAIVLQAMRWNMDPYVVGQKTHLVNDTLGYEAQLVVAVVQNSGAIVGSFRYEWEGAGQDMKCRAGAVLRGETDVTWGPWLRNGDVTTRNSPLWKTNPAQQLGYRQAANWARLYCPGALLGVYITDEIDPTIGVPRNMGAADVVGAPAPAARTATLADPDTLKAAREHADKGRAVFAEWWAKASPQQRGSLREEIADLQKRCDTADAERTVDAATVATDAQAAANATATPAADSSVSGPAVADADFVAQMEAAERAAQGGANA